jgi:primase-polymerase (primpol)-like protein
MLEELQEYDHFVTWKRTPEGKKIPFNPTTGLYARTDTPDTWGSIEQALKALRTGKYHGIGFVFAEDDPFVGIDIDHCVINGQLTPEAENTITDFWSYTEYSPSKTGLHILVEGTVPEGKRKHRVEVYATGRYFTITTNQVKGTPETIEDRQPQLDKLYASLSTQQNHRQAAPQQEYQIFVSDEKVLEKACNARNGQDFKSLYDGNISGFQSKSHADWQLVLWLLYYSNDDVGQVKRLFLTSKLVDEKTLRPTKETDYLSYTIERALRKRHR